MSAPNKKTLKLDPENTVAFMGVEGANADLACRQHTRETGEQRANSKIKRAQHTDIHAEGGDGIQIERTGANTNAYTRVAQETEQANDRSDHD